MADHNEYLAVTVANEGQNVTYRMLSRALKIHSNKAKQLLNDYYTRQKKRKPGSVFATYIITGRQRSHAHTNGVHSQASQDVPMPSSPPFPSSSAPQHHDEESNRPRWTKVVVLAKETDLETVKDGIDEVECVHIYSLSSTAISDLYSLADCTRKVNVAHASEDPLEKWAQYGTIQNPNVWRRTRNGQPVPVPAPTSQPVAATATTTKAAAQLTDTSKAEPIPAPAASQKTSSQTSKSNSMTAAAQRPATLKKERSSIMSSFAKTKAAPPKAPQQPTAATTAAAAQPDPALSDEDMLDDEDGDGLMDVDTEPGRPAGKSKREREDELRKMMEQDDDDRDDDNDNAEGAIERKNDDHEADGDVEMGDDAAEADQTALGQQQQQQNDGDKDPQTEADPAAVSNGRRRGRRKVMKKRTVKDEEGYLVTKEEAAWESFSEDDVPVKPVVAVEKKKKQQQQQPPTASTTTKDNKANGDGCAPAIKKSKVGNGSIMSFFAKK